MTTISVIMLGLIAFVVGGITLFARLALSGQHVRRQSRMHHRSSSGRPVDHGSYRHGGGGWFVD